MRRFRKLLVTLGVAAALLLPLASVASADPNDGGFTDPTITAGPNTVTILGPAGGAIVTKTASATLTAADPNDGGFGP